MLDDVMNEVERLNSSGGVCSMTVHALPGRVTITIAFGPKPRWVFQGSSRTETTDQALAILQATAS